MQPKGAAGSKWKSKVRWDLENEIDLRALSGEVEALPGVDKELQGRRKDRPSSRSTWTRRQPLRAPPRSCSGPWAPPSLLAEAAAVAVQALEARHAGDVPVACGRRGKA